MSHLVGLRPLRAGWRRFTYRGEHRPPRFRRLTHATVGLTLFTAVHLG